ncbi:MAG TPA: hypothetical protein VN256_10915 [Pyrinomonadaceae bacterium]|nr:hypothetical protein [Pyrinomonadaceae bacterium]
MSFDAQKLYALLPAVYRQRDAEQGGPLRALIETIAGQVAVLEEDLAQLYDDQFIETCAEWVVPYIGDLVGARGLFSWPGAAFSNRAQVANTLAYRRRKGTAAVIEQLAHDATGWNSNVVEFFQLLATTEYMKHLRPTHFATPNMRDWDALARINTPFDTAAHTAEMRHIDTRAGKYNIPNIGIFLWRLGSHSLTNAPAYKLDDRRYLFNPLGFETPLYSLPETEKEITHLAARANVPAPFDRRALARDKELYYGADKSLVLNIDGNFIAAAEVDVCNLEGSPWPDKANDRHVIDPALGRIFLPDGVYADPVVRVLFHYGFSAEMGGGEYGRAATFADELKPVVKVPGDEAAIQDAINGLSAGGAVEIEDNNYYFESPFIHAPAGRKVELRAADERRPVIVPDNELFITGNAGSEVTLNGLVLNGGTIHLPTDRFGEKNELRLLRIVHCTLLPGPSKAIGNVPAEAAAASRIICDAPDVTIEIERSIVGAIEAVEGARVRVRDSIVDATSETEFAYSAPSDEVGAPLEVENSTVIGRVKTQIIEASNTIFMAGKAPGEPLSVPIEAERLQEGCVRFSYVPPGAVVPRQYMCQPKKGDSAQEQKRLRPLFTSLSYGDAGYCQLSARCAVEIREGADDESEMGAFHHLYQPQREANLRTRLSEYLRFGLEAGIFYAS